MARRKRGHRMSGWRKTVRKVGSAVGSILILGPVIVPAYNGAVGAMQGKDFVQEFVYDASAYNLQAGALDTAHLQDIAKRDVVLVGLGLITKWLVKRA